MVIKMKAIETALSLTQAYKLGIERFEKMLGDEFSKAIELMNKTNEHIIICGMGKSGLVGRKISSTLASTGCLLYTSPSPRDQRGSRMPSSA